MSLKYALERIESGPLYKHMERDYSMFFLTAFGDCHSKANAKRYGNNGLTAAFMVYKDLISRYYRLEEDNEVICANVSENIHKNSKIKDEIFENYSEAGEKMKEFYSRIENDDEFDGEFIKSFSEAITKLITYQVTILHRNDSFVELFNKNPGVADEIQEIRKKYESVFGQFETKFEIMCQKLLKKYPTVTMADLKHMTCTEFTDFVETGEIPKEKIEDRKNLAVISYLPEVEIFTGETAKTLYEAIQKNEEKYHPKSESKSISGKSVYGTGKIIAKCQVITDYSQIRTFEEGNILVTPSTLPKYNDIYVKAKAIVTNEGSILSHAAIFCREFKVPGIIGTKIATNFLKTGDEVEFDADKGLVRILK